MKKIAWTSAALVALTLAGCGTNANQSALSNQAGPTQASTNGSSTTSETTVSLKTQNVSLTVLPGGRLGPDGKMHDTVTDPNFTLVEGVPV